MSPVPVFAYLALAALAVWISARFFGHPFSPFSIFYGIWFAALAIYNLHWIEYIPIRRPAWTLMALSLLSFAVGWLIPYLLWDSRQAQGPEMVASQVSPDRLRTVILIFFVLGVIWAIIFLSAIRSNIGLAALIEAPGELRNAGTEDPLKILDWLNVANLVLSTFYLFVLKPKRSLVIWLVLVFSIAALFLKTDRTHFFYAFSWAGFVVLHSMKATLKKVIALVTVGAGLLLGQFFLVAIWLGKVAENIPVIMETANVRNAMLFMLGPYIYITESFPSLQAYMDSAPRSTHGLMTFYPAFRLVHLIDPTVEQPAIVAEFVQVPFDSNTFTWLHQFYTDFGTTGVLIGPWIIGALTSCVYFQMLRTRSFYSTLVNGLFSYCLALSVFVNHFTQGPAWYFLVVTFLIALWVRNPMAKLRPAEV